MKDMRIVAAVSRGVLALALIVGLLCSVEGAQNPQSAILLHSISVAVPSDITIGITTATGAKGSDDDCTSSEYFGHLA